MSKIPAISLRSQWLGERLRAARLASGYLMREAADYIQTDQTTLGRFERGTHKMRRVYVQGLIDFYSITDRRERQMLLRLADDAWRKDWWDGDSGDLDAGFIDYTWLEARAQKIMAFEPLLVHGLLQTPEYAHALARIGLAEGDDQIREERVGQVRATRQQILSNSMPTNLSIVLEEPALRRTISSKKIARQQLEHLVEAASRSNIELSVLTMAAHWDPGYNGPFSYFEMADPYPNVAYIENLAGRTFVEEKEKVKRFKRKYDEIHRLSLSPRKSVTFIKQVLKELK